MLRNIGNQKFRDKKASADSTSKKSVFYFFAIIKNLVVILSPTNDVRPQNRKL